MKKIIIMLISCVLLTGCGTYKLEDATKDFTKSVESSKSYKLNGVMEISSGEEIFTYNIETYYLKDDYYKVILVNQTNNHKQVILKNKDGLYVVTPSLNKSFKFDSIWPENSSQSYLLQNLLNDVKSDNNKEFISENNKTKSDDETLNKCILIIIKLFEENKVNYPNNEDLTYEKIYFNKDMKIEKVEVYSKDDLVKIKAEFKSVDLKAKLKEDDFKLSSLIDTSKTKDNSSNETTENENKNNTNQNNQGQDSNIENKDNQDKDTQNKNATNNNEESGNVSNADAKEEDTKTCENETCDKKSSLVDNIIYPLYIPANTHLQSSETVETDGADRVILTFAGDKNFVIVEETLKASDEFEIIPVLGDPLLLDKTIAVISNNSISWHADNMSYYLVSSDLSSSELVSVATSLGNSKTVVSTK